MYLLDTCICIELMRGNLPIAYQMMSENNPRLFKIPAVVEAELYLGALKSNNKEANRNITERFLLPFEVLPFDSECALMYAKIRSELELQGKIIGPNDLLIAATALAKQAILVSNNHHEFQRVPNLELESWAEIAY